jgi:hypothetical protein
MKNDLIIEEGKREGFFVDANCSIPNRDGAPP